MFQAFATTLGKPEASCQVVIQSPDAMVFAGSPKAKVDLSFQPPASTCFAPLSGHNDAPSAWVEVINIGDAGPEQNAAISKVIFILFMLSDT